LVFHPLEFIARKLEYEHFFSITNVYPTRFRTPGDEMRR
jgi:hypothetical protein